VLSRLFLTFVVLFLLGERVHASQNQVHVRNEAQIALSNVELGAIADIVTTNIDDDKALRALNLGEGPKAGKVVEWTAAEISKRLRPFNRVLQGVQLKLPDRIIIRRAVDFITRDALRSQIEEMLKLRTLPDPSWEAKLTDIQLQTAGLNIPPDGSVQVVPPLTRPKGAASFEVVISKHGQVIKRHWINAKVAYFAPVAKTLRRIEANSHLSDADVKWQKEDVTFLNEIPAQVADLPTATTRHSLQPGVLVTRSHLARETAVKFGQEIEVVAGGDAFSVSTKGFSQQNGYIGDIVKVKSQNTNKILSGVITARGVVRVNY